MKGKPSSDSAIFVNNTTGHFHVVGIVFFEITKSILIFNCLQEV